VRWFQVDSDAPDDPKIKALIRRGLTDGGGPAGAAQAVGHLFLLWCYVANHGAGLPGWGVKDDGSPLPLGEMADECLLDEPALRSFLDFLADKEHIDTAQWTQHQTVVLPGMTRRADAYARSKGRGKSTPERPGGDDAGEAGRKVAHDGPDSPLHTTPHQTIPNPDLLQGVGPGQAEGVVQLWNDTRRPGPKVAKLTDDLRRKILRTLATVANLDDWKRVIEYLNGQAWANASGTGEHASYRANLQLLLRPGKLTELLDRANAPAGRPAVGRTAVIPGKFAGLR
jgi:hypothetical protein